MLRGRKMTSPVREPENLKDTSRRSTSLASLAGSGHLSPALSEPGTSLQPSPTPAHICLQWEPPTHSPLQCRLL
ncbi:unnamed protein product [Nyctereutes procyonoides]|uniref:(raccoon dog) hypothetical protein n=1 Tax=Nyctereutes procyonoides TaxID=34880 RepID=A0A811ZGR5_NYCPR|nr:unnamed protein product [Nyctereutes procyonoides]